MCTVSTREGRVPGSLRGSTRTLLPRTHPVESRVGGGRRGRNPRGVGVGRLVGQPPGHLGRRFGPRRRPVGNPCPVGVWVGSHTRGVGRRRERFRPNGTVTVDSSSANGTHATKGQKSFPPPTEGDRLPPSSRGNGTLGETRSLGTRWCNHSDRPRLPGSHRSPDHCYRSLLPDAAHLPDAGLPSPHLGLPSPRDHPSDRHETGSLARKRTENGD